MSESHPLLSEELHHYLVEQQRELQGIKEQFYSHYHDDEFIKKSFQTFIEHKIDDTTFSIAEYLEKNASSHRLTPSEIDQILNYVMRTLQKIASLDQEEQTQEQIKAKGLILNWIRQRVFQAQKPKESKVKILCELLRQYAVANRFERDEIYARIKYYLNNSSLNSL